jgi:hypothetical protein
MARRARVHSRDVQLQIAAPKGKFAAARIQRLDFPWSASVQNIDELGRKLRVGTTTDIPEVSVTFEAFDVSHNIYAYLTGYTPGTFPASGVSVTELKNIDLIGQIRDTSSTNIVNAIYVKRGIITGMDASFGVRDNSTVSYTVGSNSKKELKQPVFYDTFTASGGQTLFSLSKTPTYLTRTSGYILNGYQTTAATNGGSYLSAGTDFTNTGTTLVTLVTPAAANDTLWFTYSSANTTTTFDALDDVAPAAIQGKYVPVTISVSNIPRVQSATVRASMQSETILEMGGLGQPVGYEIGIPDVTGDLSVLKTDNDLLSIFEGTTAATTIEQDMEFAKDTLPLKIQLKDPRNPARTVLTYYVPSITVTSEGDESSVNQSMNETFSWSSTTGELFIASGNGPW